ncbi:kinesin-like protein KIN-6 [Canna indica]|uniref:Kinesin-like protein KIN-6 n=1 Tax=Canna indica TaxID=4628 RepID=A0AAQ3JYM9_9LILI|nr:kinesin-like protein KIN-6 [Canna indica]
MPSLSPPTESSPPLSPPATVRRNPPRRARQTPAAKALHAGPPPRETNVPAPAPAPAPTSASENLKVFLRIRPLHVTSGVPGCKPSKADGRVPGKGAPPKAESGKNTTCLTVNGPSSVTLTSPLSLHDQKRVKSEVYDGFSFVFPPDTTQQEVYARAINPILMDFMRGTSSLLVALGPTGSGKTYTMFGCATDPGVVPLTLKQFFNYPSEGTGHATRSFYISILEIYSERGKGERILDLSADGEELSFQNSTMIGLKEVMVSNIEEAEHLLALGMLKRSTASTSANNQSSRSQCIINIRSAEKSHNGHNSHSAVLTIADLAGAERERKTGNQGARLQESNFINNTSMVFGQCLRSLHEHQRNPKKPLEKHFKSSMLTRYLRDYMEGKKRMTLILTVKPGEDDYADTSFLLRQASPYMKIKFTNIEEPPNLPNKKRITSSLITDHHKRRKINVSETSVDDEGSHRSNRNDGSRASKKDADTKKLQEVVIPQSSVISTEVLMPMTVDTALNDAHHMELLSLARKEEIMRNFSKALWTTLKQYKQKLIESEKNAQSLREALRKEEVQVMELNKEIEELKSRCSCQKPPHVGESSSAKVYARLDCSRTGLGTPSYQVSSSPTFHNGSTLGIAASQSAQSVSCDQDLNDHNCLLVDQIPENLPGMEIIHDDCNGLAVSEPTMPSTNLNKSEFGNESASSFDNLSMVGGRNVSSSMVDETTNLKENKRQSPEPGLSQAQHLKSSDKYYVRRVLKEKNATVSQSSNVDKPKRKLRPASSMLLKDLTGLDMETTNRETRDKSTDEGQGISQNNASLLCLLRKQS